MTFILKINTTNYLLPSSGQHWIHISVLPVYVLKKPETHSHTQLSTFHLKRSVNNIQAFFINVQLDLEQKKVHIYHYSTLKSTPFNFKLLITRSIAEWILDLTPSSAAVRGWFGLYNIGTCTTCRYWKTWNPCFVLSGKKWYIPPDWLP